MTIRDVISNTSLMKEDNVIYAKKIDGRFFDYSEIVILELMDEEQEMLTSKIAELKCPGFEYFLEAFIIKEMVADFNNSNSVIDLQKKIETIIHYAEYDA